MSAPVRVSSAIICEDIRPEPNGKFTLLGVFGSDLSMQTIPGHLVLAAFAQVEISTVGEFDAELRILGPQKEEFLKGRIHASLGHLGSSGMALGPFAMHIREPGKVVFQWRFNGGRWEVIKEFNIRLDPNIVGESRTVVLRGERPGSSENQG